MPPRTPLFAGIGATKREARAQIGAIGFEDTIDIRSDLTGTYEIPLVKGIQGSPVSPLPPTPGQVLTWNGTEWIPGVGGGPSGIGYGDAIPAGDLSGTYGNPTVIALQGNPISPAVPTDGNILVWTGGAWTPVAGDSVFLPADASSIQHSFLVTPAIANGPPGQMPDVVVIGPTTVGLHYTRDDGACYTLSKIPSSFVGDASFHIHWTKNVDTNQSGRTVRWILTYTVFNGSSQNANVAPTGTIVWDLTYLDSGTTSRIVYRSGNTAVAGLIPGYYLGVKLEYDPLNTTLDGRPTVVSVDLLARLSVVS